MKQYLLKKTIRSHKQAKNSGLFGVQTQIQESSGERDRYFIFRHNKKKLSKSLKRFLLTSSKQSIITNVEFLGEIIYEIK